MPQFNIQMLTNILSSALTATVASWLSYLAAWSHFSDSNNTALATVIAAGLAIAIGQLLTIFLNRWSTILDRVGKGGSRIVTATQAEADALPNNPNVMGPTEAQVVKQ